MLIIYKLKLVEKYAELRPFLIFCVIGGSGVLLNAVILYTLVEYGHLNYLLAGGISSFTAMVSNYFFNRVFTFKGSPEKSILRGLVKYTAMSIISLGINLLVLYIAVDLIGMWYMFGMGCAIAASTIWNYFSNRSWTFKMHQISTPSTSPSETGFNQ